MAIIGRYGPRQAPMGEQEHPADHFARALGVWMAAMQAEPADYLGRTYEEQAVANAYAGQFFTPESVVELMAAMTLPEDLPDDAVVADPACGSGRMLVAGIRRNCFATFIGTDTDLTCVHMTALNCLVRNANTWIIHGNSLSLDAWGGYHVRRTWLGGTLHRLTPEQAAEILRMPFPKPAATTGLTSPAIHQTDPEAKAALDRISGQFTTDEKGQKGFGF